MRRAGNRLRITAQLIDVADGYHLWSERYDRELIDVFAIQDEIATAIAVRLRPSLGRETWDPPKPPTTNLEAYELYLKGRALAYQRGRILLEAVEALERAIALDDRFAHAHAALAEAFCFVGYYGLMPLRDVIARAESLAARAISLGPDLAEAHHALGVWGMMYGRDRRAAARALERALALNPYSTPVRCAHAHWRRAVAEQNWDLAVSEAGSAAAADPLNGFAHAIYSLLLSFAGRYLEAARVASRAAELDPSSTLARLVGQLAWGWGGHHDKATNAARAALALSARNPFPLATYAAECGRAGQSPLAHAILAELSARATYEDVLPSHLALAALAAGRHDEAVAWCYRGVDEGDAHLRTETLNERFVDWRPLRSHPDWPALRAHIATATGAN